MDLNKVDTELKMSEAMEFYEIKKDGMTRQERRAYLRMVAKMNKKQLKGGRR